MLQGLLGSDVVVWLTRGLQEPRMLVEWVEAGASWGLWVFFAQIWQLHLDSPGTVLPSVVG